MDKIDAVRVTRLGDFLAIGQLLEALCNFKEITKEKAIFKAKFWFVQVFRDFHIDK